jgi:hypothetical protein
MAIVMFGMRQHFYGRMMTTFDWKIIETVIKDGILEAVKYRCKATDDKNSVETEGNWKMLTPHMMDEDTTEHQVLHWLDLDATQDGKHLIKYRLQEQLDALSLEISTKPPWAVDTFKVTI